MPKDHNDDDTGIDDIENDDPDDEPLPVKRDTRIFHRKKEDDDEDKDFEEDVFV